MYRTYFSKILIGGILSSLKSTHGFLFELAYESLKIIGADIEKSGIETRIVRRIIATESI
jgi:hypothetical protein